MWYIGGLFFPILPTNLTFLFLPPLLICTPFTSSLQHHVQETRYIFFLLLITFCDPAIVLPLRPLLEHDKYVRALSIAVTTLQHKLR